VATSDPLFNSVISKVVQHTRLPVLLPKKMPNVGQDAQSLYAWIKDASVPKYIIVLSFLGPPGTPCAPDRGREAADSPVCRFASFSGEIAQMPKCAPSTTVVLMDNLHGCLTSATIGAGVGESEIVWLDAGIRYRITIKGGTDEDVTILAKEVIRSHQ
jgi:hypothetical protein